MLDNHSQDEVKSVARTTSIIVFALCGGVMAFGVFVVFLHEAQQPPVIGSVTYLSLGVAGVSTVLSFIVPRLLVHNGRKQLAAGHLSYQGGDTPNVQTDAGKLALVYQQTTIIGCAMIEGAAFFALVAYMIEGHIASLIVAVVLLIGIAMHMPVGDRLSWWTARHRYDPIRDAYR